MKDLDKSRDTPHSWVEVLNIVKYSILLRILPILSRQIAVQSQSKLKGSRIVKAILKTKKKFGVLALPDLKIQCETTVVKTVYYWHQDKKMIIRIENPKIDLQTYRQPSFYKGKIQWRKKVVSMVVLE